MSLVRGMLSRFIASRVRPLEADWWPQRAKSALVVGSCSAEFTEALVGEIRRRGGEVRVCMLAGGVSQTVSEVEPLIARAGCLGRLATLRTVRKRRFAVCLIPLGGGGSRALKALGVLSGARCVVLCPTPDQWHLLARPHLSARGLVTPFVNLTSKAVALVSITARCSWILLRRRLSRRPRPAA
jgi:hypothetical protein